MLNLVLGLFLGAIAATIASAAGEAATPGARWLSVAWVLTALLWASWLAVVLFWLFRGIYRYGTAITFRPDWRCTYWPKEHDLGVTLWFTDASEAQRYRASCRVWCSGEPFDIPVRHIGGMYMGNAGTMLEFYANGVEADATATHVSVEVKLKPLGTLKGKTARYVKTVPLQIVQH